MRSGAAAVLPNLAREHERALLREKLQQDSYTAQTAQAALDAAEAQADLLLRQIEIVTRRRDAAARAALVEHAAASAMGVKYMAAIAALEAALTPLMALANVVGDVHADGNPDKRFRSFYEDTFRARLPTFALAGIPGQWDAVSTQWTSDSRKVAVEVDDEMVSRAVEPWRRLLQLWVANPRAKPPAGV